MAPSSQLCDFERVLVLGPVTSQWQSPVNKKNRGAEFGRNSPEQTLQNRTSQTAPDSPKRLWNTGRQYHKKPPNLAQTLSFLSRNLAQTLSFLKPNLASRRHFVHL